MHIHTSDQSSLELGFGEYTCNWGLHICGLYENENERDAIIMNYLRAGDIAGDLQLYCPVERTIEEFHIDYAKLFQCDPGHTHDENCFRIHSARELYYPEGIFSPWAMDESLGAFFIESQKFGARNIRGTAEMAWALEAIPGVEHLMAYESRLNLFIPDKPWISICMYNLKKFSGSTIMDVLRTHPYTITGGTITENPFYMDPDEWLSMNAPRFLDR